MYCVLNFHSNPYISSYFIDLLQPCDHLHGSVPCHFFWKGGMSDRRHQDSTWILALLSFLHKALKHVLTLSHSILSSSLLSPHLIPTNSLATYELFWQSNQAKKLSRKRWTTTLKEKRKLFPPSRRMICNSWMKSSKTPGRLLQRGGHALRAHQRVLVTRQILSICYDFEGSVLILNSRSFEGSEPRRVPPISCWFILVVWEW